MPTCHAVPFALQLPPGAGGGGPVPSDVRCFVLPHAGGVVLVDAGLPGSAEARELAALDVARLVASHGPELPDGPDRLAALVVQEDSRRGPRPRPSCARRTTPPRRWTSPPSSGP